MPRFAEDMDKDKARRLAIMLLCGPAMADQAIPSWPPSRTGYNDEELVAILVDYLGLTEASYHGLCADMWKFTCEPRFIRLFETITGLYERFPTLDEDMLRLAQQIGGTCEPG